MRFWVKVVATFQVPVVLSASVADELVMCQTGDEDEGL